MSQNIKKKVLGNSETSIPSIPTKILAEMALMIALSSALHLIKLITLPQGGSVTLGSMVPITSTTRTKRILSKLIPDESTKS